jgi:hypothetical protein
MEGTLKSVRSYKKTPAITVPETPEFLQRLLPADSSSSHPPSPNDTRGPSSTTLGSPFNGPGWLDGSSSQPRLRQSPQSDSQKLALKFEKMEALLSDWDSILLVNFWRFYSTIRFASTGQSDPRGSFHAKAVSRFLQGRNNTKMSDIISLIYGHKHSAPSPGSPHILSAMPHSHLQFLLKKYFMLVLPYFHGQQISSPIMFTARSTLLLPRTITPTFEH